MTGSFPALVVDAIKLQLGRGHSAAVMARKLDGTLYDMIRLQLIRGRCALAHLHHLHRASAEGGGWGNSDSP